MTAIFDTHAHYDDKNFDGDRETLLDALPGAGIGRVVNVGASLASCRRSISLAEKYDFIYAAVGVHPNETGKLEEESSPTLNAPEQLKAMCRHPKCVAVGEIGLDYYWDEPAREIQKKWFVHQLRLARDCSLPVIIHSRDAAKDTIDLMKSEKAQEIGGVIHCFSYSKESARIFLDMGFYIGIGGVITFRNAKKLKEAAEFIPMDKIVLETDCPYLAPAPFRGKRNSSLNLPYVVAALAQVKGISEEAVRKAAWENGLRLYGMNA
ncbi:MAG: TatD family hydrolase [Lachnospiraceae bacterium]|jgi:TatD DNase family protein|nr:TatD family hydrolase [Lachnospiraceae bacterium]